MSDGKKYDGAIEEALGLLGKYATLTPNVEALVRDTLTEARAELEAIKKACRVVDNFGVVHSMRFDESKEDDELNDAADFLCAIGRDEGEE